MTAVALDNLAYLPCGGVVAARGAIQLESDNAYGVVNLEKLPIPTGFAREDRPVVDYPCGWFYVPYIGQWYLGTDGKPRICQNGEFAGQPDARRIILKPVPAEPAPLKGFLCQNCSRVEVDGQGFVCDACIKMWTKPLAGSFAAKIIAAAVEDERMLAKESGIPAPKDAAVFDSLVEIATRLHYDAKDRVRAAELLMIAKGYNVIPASS